MPERVVGIVERTDLVVAVFSDTDPHVPIIETNELIVVAAGGTQGVAGPAASFAVETPTGTVNGSNVTFTISQTPTGLFALMLNGLLQKEGASNDFTRSGTTITFNAAPLTGDVLQAIFSY